MEARVEKPHRIADYCRISVDVEADRDNTSIENQKDIISDYVQRYFPDRKIQSKCISVDFYVLSTFYVCNPSILCSRRRFFTSKNGLNPLTAC